MHIRDWRQPEEYDFALQLSPAQWAWEFLRRNPVYQAEWQAFHATWLALEAAYGRPPDRDFCAWKNDPRAWLPAAECPDGECRVDADKVLIECALGARWGFVKFPPDPADDDAVAALRLAWPDGEGHAVQVEADDAAWLGTRSDRVAMGFDLALPLRGQIERAKRHLQVLQRQRERSGSVVPVSVRTRAPFWKDGLRLLDAAVESGDVLALLGPQIAAADALLAEALALRDGGYREIHGLPA